MKQPPEAQQDSPRSGGPPCSLPRPPRIVLVQEGGGTDHFAGVRESIEARADGAVRAERALPDEPLQLAPGDVLCVSDIRSFTVQYALRQARAAGACCVLLMDGIVEYRNTYCNPRSGADFLRPAPVDVVACAGANDARLLRELGNDAVATGLPRLAGIEPSPLPESPRALVATALRPHFDERERVALVEGLRRVRDVLGELGIAVDWRLTERLEEAVGVGPGCAGEGGSGARSDARGGGRGGGPRAPELALGALLARASLVISSPSTLLVEAMLAGRMTGMLFPFEAPRWPRAPVVIDRAVLADRGALRAAIEELAAGGTALRARQEQALRAMHGAPAPGGRAPDGRGLAEALADLLIELTDRPRRRAIDPTLLDPRRLPAPLPREKSRAVGRPAKTRVVSLVYCIDSPVGGVTVWSRRLARALAERDSRYDMRTLLVATHPDSLPERFTGDDGLLQTCVVDPMADRWEVLETVRAAIERLGAEIVLPNYADVCYAAATLARVHGARVVPVAHTDHASYRGLISFYDRWEAAAGVSDACMAWLAPISRAPGVDRFSPQRHRGHRGGVGLGEELELELKLGAGVDGSSGPRDGGGARPVRKIVYGAPVARAPREVEGAGPLRMAYVGRMVEAQKRISDLLGVIDGLEQRGVRGGYELHMVGDGAGLAAWRARLAERTLRSGRVVVHGRQTPEQVQALLGGIDVSILVSDYEGTSITMLEAMGAGVVPVVTRVPSGVSEWVRDGENGVVVDIGDTEAMAARLAALAANRVELARLGRRAWETVRETVSIERMADQYEELFDAAMAQPRDLRPTDRGLRFIEEWTCRKSWSDNPSGARAWIAQTLEAQGYERICLGWPLGAEWPNGWPDAPRRNGWPDAARRDGWPDAPRRDGWPDAPRRDGWPGAPRRDGWPDAPRRESGSLPRSGGPPMLDAAILPDGDPRVDALRARGIGVACSPSLNESPVRRAVRSAAAAGARRIAIYGMGLHTRRCAVIFLENLPIVGIIDDEPPAWGTVFGLPVTTVERATTELQPDCIVLSSDRCEQAMWERTAAMREAGVKVVALYGADQAPETPPARTTAATQDP